MDNVNPVQQKIACVFNICVQNEPSEKRVNQPYKVVAGDQLNSKIKDGEFNNVLITEKLDGTCVLIQEFEGKPWLWARLDRKPNKGAEKRFRKFQNQQSFDDREIDKQQFPWDVHKDFKDVPDNWIPASGVNMKDGLAMPDSIGHTPGWVPVDPKSRQHCWHLTAIDLINGIAVVLREARGSEDLLVDCVPLSNLLGNTAELIGTMVNGNPYKIGNKQCPVHVLVVHGSLRVPCLSHLDRSELLEWFENSDRGKVEGVVWHCQSGSLYKLHRNHLGLHWPVDDVVLSKRPVKITNNFLKYELRTEDRKSQFLTFLNIVDKKCEMLKDIHELIEKNS